MASSSSSHSPNTTTTTTLGREHEPIEVIIIGAGIAGLTAGLELTRAGHPVTIIEGRNRIGGRIDSWTWKTLQSHPVDLGASFLHGVDGNPLVNLLKEFNQPLHFEDEKDPIKIYTAQGQVFDDRISRRLYRQANEVFFRTARQHSQSSLLPPVEPQDNLNLADYLIHSPHSPLYKPLLTSGKEEEEEEEEEEELKEDYKPILRELIHALDSWTGAPSSQVSLNWWGFEKEYEGPDGVVPQTYHFLINQIGAKFESLGGKLRLGRRCERIRLDGSRVRVQTTGSKTNGDSEEFLAGCCICTIPLGVLKLHAGELFEPPLPPRRLLAIARTGFGLLNKVVVRYASAWWPHHARWLILLPDEEREGSDDGSETTLEGSSSGGSQTSLADWPSPKLANNKPNELLFTKAVKVQNYMPITGQAVLVFFMGAELGERVEKLSDKEVSQAVHEKLVSCLLGGGRNRIPVPPPASDGPEECVVTRWNSEEFSKGSYSFMMSTTTTTEEEGSNPIDLVEMSRPLWNGRLGFAGEHCSMNHYACVHGPYLTGIAEAKRIKSNSHRF